MAETDGRGMGRGLAAILSGGTRAETGLLRELPVELISPNPSQPRREFDEESLLGLSESIRARGILQPLVVRPLPDGVFELVAGERRLRAARMAGLERVPAVVRATEESERLELALIENMAREDLNAVDGARAGAPLVEDLGLTKEEVARRVGRSRAAVSNLIRTLELPDEALAMIERGELSGAHGKALLLCKDQAKRLQLAREARAKGWSVRETERRARGPKHEERGAGEPIVLHPDLADALAMASDALSAALGREVRVRARGARYVAEIELEHPREGLDLAERIVRKAAA